MYSVTNRNSFENLTNYFTSTNKYKEPNAITVLVANKIDEMNRVVTYEVKNQLKYKLIINYRKEKSC